MRRKKKEEIRKVIAEYREYVLEGAKKTLINDYRLSAAQTAEAVEGWRNKKELDTYYEDADLDMAQMYMHYESSLDVESLYLEYMGYSDDLRMCTCVYGGGLKISTDIRFEFMKLLRDVLFRIYGLSIAQIDTGIKKSGLDKIILIPHENEKESTLYELMHRPILEIGSEIAEGIE